jgi:hypothetical protein
MNDPAPPPLALAILRSALRLVALVAVAFALHRLILWAQPQLEASSYSWAMPGLTIAMLLLYALLIAIPFVPGIEIGLTLLMISGPDWALPVWVATTLGLALALIAGYRVPYVWLHRVFQDLHMKKACELLDRTEPLTTAERVTLLQSHLPTRIGPQILRFRYLVLAALINIPGNSVIGGGGGIALLAGLSRLFRLPVALITVALATAPVPLMVWLFDWKIPWA